MKPSQLVRASVITALFFATACVDEPPTPEPSNATPLEVSRDHLTFTDEDEFHSVMDSLVNQDEAVLDEFQARLGFVSLRDAYNAGTAAPAMYVTPGEPVIESIALATVLSPTGVVVIADTRWRIDQTGVWRTEGTGEEERVSDVQAETYEGEPERGSCPSGNGCYPQEQCTSVYQVGGIFGPQYRLRARYYTTNVFFYSEAGVSVRHQKKHTILWITIWVNYAVASVKGSGSACVGLGQWLGFPPSPPFPVPGSPFLWSISTGFSTGFNHVFWSGLVFNMRACFWDSDGMFSATTVPGAPFTVVSCTL